MRYKATKPILYMSDGRSWQPGQIVPLRTVPVALANDWIADGIVEEVVEEEVEEVEEAVEEEKPKRGRPRKEVTNDKTDTA